MRIVIDMQGAQTESRFRGIGRYSISLAQALVRNCGEHEIVLALNGLFPDTIEPIRTAFAGILPHDRIRVWHGIGPTRECDRLNAARRKVSELAREAALAWMLPDALLVTSLFEGLGDDAVTSVGSFDKETSTFCILYDLIPLISPDAHFQTSPIHIDYYQRKVESLKRCAGLFAISASAKKEAIEALKLLPSTVTNISTGLDTSFKPLSLTPERRDVLLGKHKLNKPFCMYTGGSDERKNLLRLVEAFAALPPRLREGHQLLLAGRMPDDAIARLRGHARSCGLEPAQLRITGYVDNKELVELYSLCRLFVFPSLHEGFGLPALEAMACGAVVIGANATSLPEVIGLEDALFDPRDCSAIAAKMSQALEDEAFRSKLRSHAEKQAEKFSWDTSAKRVIEALEVLNPARGCSNVEGTAGDNRLYRSVMEHVSRQDEGMMIALARCLARNRQSGLERQLFLDVSELCQHDAASGVQRVVRSYLRWILESPPAGFRIEPVYATPEEGYRYACRFTMGFLGKDQQRAIDRPVRWQRGDIFFGLDMQHHVQLAHRSFYQQLRRDGVTVKFLVYDLLPIQLEDLFRDPNAKRLHERWLTMVSETDGAICISKATADAFDRWIDASGLSRSPAFQNTWVHIGADIEGSVPSRGLPPAAPKVLSAIKGTTSFLCVATLEPRKGQGQILDAMEILWSKGADAALVLVGQPGWKTEALGERLRSHPELDRRLFWLQGISDEYLTLVYEACTCLVAASLNEGFGLPMVEAARYGIPVIARDIPVFREVAGDQAYYFKGLSAVDLAAALGDWISLYRQRKHPQPEEAVWFSWEKSTDNLKNALINQCYRRQQLLVDISELVQRDSKSGIQRVVRSILSEWLLNPPEGYRVEPVYAALDHGYRYARQFVGRFLNQPHAALEDEPIDYAPGDIFFCLDLKPEVQASQQSFYRELRQNGLRVLFAVYDLLCVQMPQFFAPQVREAFHSWLRVAAEGDGAICISEAVANELSAHLRIRGSGARSHLKIDWFHLGAQINTPTSTKGLPSDAINQLETIREQTTFLMVGTLEPRKAHAQVLNAFELLWLSPAHRSINLVLVGKQGWMVSELSHQIAHHPELNRRLFWFQDASDQYLEELYSASSCLIAASYGEGFGLPLIEAARHRLPIIARDIPVFREVAREHAYYFRAETVLDLAQALETWLETYKLGRHPPSTELPWLTWQQSAAQLMSACLRD